MMRRTLIVISSVIVIAMAVTPVLAGEINWSAGVMLTEKEAGASMGSRLAAVRIQTNSFGRVSERVFGSWFSTTGMLPELLFGKSIAYDAMADFANIRNVEKVVVSPDNGLTEWEAIQMPLWGWTARLGEMPPGPHALWWGVYSRDKKNRLVLFIIPINWSSGRTSSVVQQVNVLRAPVGCDSYSDEEWLALLRGFRPVDAQLDPQFLAMKQARAQLGQATQPVPSPPTPTSSIQIDKDEVVKAVPVEMSMVLLGNDIREFPVNINVELKPGEHLVFERHGRLVAEAVVTKLIGHSIEAKIIRGGRVRFGDEIFRR